MAELCLDYFCAGMQIALDNVYTTCILDGQEELKMTDSKSRVLQIYPEASASTWKNRYWICRPRTAQDAPGRLTKIPMTSLFETEQEAWDAAGETLPKTNSTEGKV
jgi:hypothetical protein